MFVVQVSGQPHTPRSSEQFHSTWREQFRGTYGTLCTFTAQHVPGLGCLDAEVSHKNVLRGKGASAPVWDMDLPHRNVRGQSQIEDRGWWTPHWRLAPCTETDDQGAPPTHGDGVVLAAARRTPAPRILLARFVVLTEETGGKFSPETELVGARDCGG